MKKKLLGITVAVVVIMFGTVFGVVYWKDSNYFSEETVVASTNISGQSYEAAKESIEERLKTYELKIVGRGTIDVITADQIGLTYQNVDETLNDLLDNQKQLIWFLKSAEGTENELKIGYDQQKMADVISRLHCMNIQENQPKDAYIAYEDGAYRIVAEERGNVLKKEQAQSRILEAIEQSAAEVFLENDYEEPKYTSDSKELIEQLQQIEKMMSAHITVTDGHNTEVVDKSVVADMIVLKKDFKAGLDKDKLQAYVKEHFPSAFNSIGRQRTLKTALGEEITLSGGSYGSTVDVEGETERLYKEIKKGKTDERDPICTLKEVSRENDGVGNTFVEVDISKQTLWYVKEGKVVLESPVVTGCISKNRGTPNGIYYVGYKARDYTMRTYNSFVHYWMPYDLAEGIGFHDAMWRGSFGGSIYLTSGSHGCVNMPLAKARELFENMDAGTPVVVHGAAAKVAVVRQETPVEQPAEEDAEAQEPEEAQLEEAIEENTEEAQPEETRKEEAQKKKEEKAKEQETKKKTEKEPVEKPEKKKGAEEAE